MVVIVSIQIFRIFMVRYVLVSVRLDVQTLWESCL